MWRADGWGWRARIGLLVPHADICEEAKFMAMARAGVSIHTTRVPFRGMGRGGTITPSIRSNPLSAYLEPPLLDDATELLAYAPVQCICLAFTNTSFLGTVDDDRALMKRLEQRTNEIPVIDTCLAVLAALRAVGARRLAFINPPWVDAAMTKRGAAQVLFWYALRRTRISRHVSSGRARMPEDCSPAHEHRTANNSLPPELIR